MAEVFPIEGVDEALNQLRKRRQQVADDCEAARNAGEVDAYIKLLPQLASLEDSLERAEKKHVRLSREGPNHPAWQVRAAQLEQDLTEYYGSRGPQYHIMVKHLAAAQIRFEQAQASGRDVDIDEFRKILAAAQTCIYALQKHTESMKIDHTEGRMEGVTTVLRIVEELVAPAYPELYAHIVDTLVERAKGGGRATAKSLH
jgi:predicted metal-dependent hydrolase